MPGMQTERNSFLRMAIASRKKFQRRPEAKQPSHESGERLAGIGWPAASETPVFQGEKLYLTVLVRGSQDS
jgi:hypothetical protein